MFLAMKRTKSSVNHTMSYGILTTKRRYLPISGILSLRKKSGDESSRIDRKTEVVAGSSLPSFRSSMKMRISSNISPSVPISPISRMRSKAPKNITMRSIAQISSSTSFLAEIYRMLILRCVSSSGIQKMNFSAKTSSMRQESFTLRKPMRMDEIPKKALSKASASIFEVEMSGMASSGMFQNIRRAYGVPRPSYRSWISITK